MKNNSSLRKAERRTRAIERRMESATYAFCGHNHVSKEQAEKCRKANPIPFS